MLMADYDIGQAFAEIEDDLIASMMRNIGHHRAEETREGFNWAQWQVKQLQELEAYKRRNRKLYKKQFQSINNQVKLMIDKAREAGNMEQEIEILRSIQNGYKPHLIPPHIRDMFAEMKGKSLKEKAGILLRRNIQMQTNGEFFKTNDRKLNALIKATQNDFARAEMAMLRMANDQYRKIIFNAQVYANTGAGTYERAVDMATKDFLSRGINCIEYKNGARHTISEYADMAIKTATKRAYLAGEGEKRQEWGIHTVIINKRGNACPLCLPFVGKVLIDDVWSGGSQKDGPYMLMSSAMAAGLYHPRCKDIHTTYFPGISSEGATYTREELAKVEEDYKQEQKAQNAVRQAARFGRLAMYSLDPVNSGMYQRREKNFRSMEFNIVQDQQDYSPIQINKSDSIYRRRNMAYISAHGVASNNNMYLSDSVRIKPRQLHSIDSSISKTFGMFKGIEGMARPTIVIASGSELGGAALASYNAMDNVLYVSERLGIKKGLDALQEGYAASNNPLSTYYHELLHWKDAREYVSKYGEISNQVDYLKWIRSKSKKEVVKLREEGYNLKQISSYATESLGKHKYDEVYTEYRVLERMG